MMRESSIEDVHLNYWMTYKEKCINIQIDGLLEYLPAHRDIQNRVDLQHLLAP